MKRLIFYILIVAILFSSLGYFYVSRKNRTEEISKSEQNAGINEASIRFVTPSGLKFEGTKCLVSDSISFKRYETREISEPPQKNLGYPNNKFGLYIYSTKDFIYQADALVNTNGGDWGYVLIPYNVKDYDDSKWKEVFDALSKKHLIPVIQLWDVDPKEYKYQTRAAVKFLNKFAWPTKVKYISAYNEMNDSRFWNGDANPEEYSEILKFTIETFKAEDQNFFVMNGAFNTTAPNGNGYIDQEAFMVRMNVRNPGVFDLLDGWASHPYPQPHYLGKPTDTGRGSIKGYEWELDLLKNRFEVKKDLPVFITETGWPHKEGESSNLAYYSQDVVSDYIKQAYENVWLKDDRVVGVMPFTVYYDPPFDHFSWVKKDGGFYPQFEAIKSIKKVAGRPPVLKEVEKELSSCN